jgi:hypothetical protein
MKLLEGGGRDTPFNLLWFANLVCMCYMKAFSTMCMLLKVNKTLQTIEGPFYLCVPCMFEGLASSYNKNFGLQGNVRVYDRIASHLAKPPKYVTTIPQYYKAVCPQLLPLLLLPFSQQENSKQVGSAAQMCVNMHHTAVIMACKLTAREHALSKECLLRPLLQPLLSWGGAICAQAKLEQFRKVVDLQETNMQEEIHVSIGTDLPCGQTLLEEIPVDISEQRETSILNSLFGIQVLLTAGHEGAAFLQQLLLQLIKPISPCILMLKILLEPDTFHQGITDEVQASSVFQKLTVADNGAQIEVAQGKVVLQM